MTLLILKKVVVLAINDSDVNVRIAKRLCSFQAAEAATDDDYFGAGQMRFQLTISAA